jgi:hypothetical protein
MSWNVVKTQDDIDFLLKTVYDFHDSCLVSLQYTSGAYVDVSDFSMNPINTERKLSMIFQSQFKECYSVELLFNKLIKLNLEPNDENYDCIIFGATIEKRDNLFFWADSPDCSYTSADGTWVASEELMWRRC